MVNLNSLPNFFILGAAKAGTTSLFNILSKHSQIYGSPVKEIGFFNNDVRFAKGLEWYQNTFFQNAQDYPIRMESTPVYLTWSEKVAVRMQHDYPIPDLQFAVIFRDPVQRAYSHYWHRVRMGHEKLPFEEAIREESNRLAQNYNELYRLGNGKYGYFRAGCYTSRLKPFFHAFNKEQFIFLLQEDLYPPDFTEHKIRILKFLQVNPAEELRTEKANQAETARFTWLAGSYRKIKRTQFGRLIRNSLGNGLRKTMRAMVYSKFEYPPLNPEFAQQLRTQYKQEIHELEEMIDRDLSAWLE